MPDRMTRRRLGFAAAITVLLLAGWAIYSRLFAPSPGITPDPATYTINGIDISAHNGDIDFARVYDSDISFAIIKATEGTDFKDRKFVENIRLAHQAGLRVGAYHFFRFDTDGRMQAINFMHSVRGRKLDFPLVIDVEEWGNPDAVATSEIIGRLRDMISHLEYYGHEVVIYTNKDGYDRIVKGNFDSYPLWLCSFSEIDPDVEWDMWQYSHRGRIDGISGPVDLNTLNPASNTLKADSVRH